MQSMALGECHMKLFSILNILFLTIIVSAAANAQYMPYQENTNDEMSQKTIIRDMDEAGNVFEFDNGQSITDEILSKSNNNASFPYLSGGIGSDEVAEMQAQKKEYNLHIMSADKDGSFTGEINISIQNSKGETIFKSKAGPLFYAELPNGIYNISGEKDGATKSQKISISNSKSAHIHFGW